MSFKQHVANVLAAIAVACFGMPVQADSWFIEGDDYVSITKHISTGSLVFTNPVSFGWRPVSIEYFPDATVTNVFTFQRVRNLKQNQYQGNVVTTNAAGRIETNYMYVVTNTVVVPLTNSFSKTTTNDTGVLLSEETDFPAYLYVRGGDVITLTSSGDTDLYVIITGLK